MATNYGRLPRQTFVFVFVVAFLSAARRRGGGVVPFIKYTPHCYFKMGGIFFSKKCKDIYKTKTPHY